MHLEAAPQGPCATPAVTPQETGGLRCQDPCSVFTAEPWFVVGHSGLEPDSREDTRPCPPADSPGEVGTDY